MKMSGGCCGWEGIPMSFDFTQKCVVVDLINCRLYCNTGDNAQSYNEQRVDDDKLALMGQACYN